MISLVADRGVSKDWLPNLRDLESLSTIHHTYGKVQSALRSGCWMQYTTQTGTIAFTRNTYQVFPTLCDLVVAHLSKFTTLPLDVKRVNLVKTQGSIPPHRDESGRNCTFNIGLLNTDSAETFTLALDTRTVADFTNFWTYATPTRCQTYSTYLLNTHSVHAVKGDLSVARYLATYGFGRDYNEVLNTLIPYEYDAPGRFL